MKRILLIIILTGMLVAVFYQDKVGHGKRIVFPGIEDISSAEIDIGGPPGRNIGPVKMNLNDDMQKLTVAKILYWLKEAQYMGPAKDQFISHGGGPEGFVIKTKNGRTITIVNAIGSVSAKIANGVMMSSVSIWDQITVYDKNEAMRFKAPALKQWIENDLDKIIKDHTNE